MHESSLCTTCIGGGLAQTGVRTRPTCPSGYNFSSPSSVLGVLKAGYWVGEFPGQTWLSVDMSLCKVYMSFLLLPFLSVATASRRNIYKVSDVGDYALSSSVFNLHGAYSFLSNPVPVLREKEVA